MAVQRQVVEEMLHVREAFGTAIIIVTHDIGVVSAMADKHRRALQRPRDGIRDGEGRADPQNDYTVKPAERSSETEEEKDKWNRS